jgi:hypothetical protein
MLDANQITALSVTSAVTGVATTALTLTGAPNGDGTHFQAAFAPSGQCSDASARVGAALLTTGDNTLPAVTFAYQGDYVVCWSTDNGVTWVPQTTPVMSVATSFVFVRSFGFALLLWRIATS